MMGRLPAIRALSMVASRSKSSRISMPSSSSTRQTMAVFAPIATTSSPVAGVAWFSSEKKSQVQLIKELRVVTGAPMVECKKALSATDNILQLAMDWLRKHGSAKASSKVEGRDVSEGLIGLLVSEDATQASLVRIASETDFSARSQAFGTLVETVAQVNLDQYTDDVTHLLMASVDENRTVQDAMNDAVLSIRENLQIAQAHRVQLADDGSVVCGYVHNRVPHSNCAGTAAALVELGPSASLSKEELKEVGKKLAMHIVAAKPLYLDPSSVPTDVLEKERSILLEQMGDTMAKKKPEIQEQILNGRLQKFYESVCLTEQAHMVEEDNPKVSAFLNKLGVTLKNFQRLSIQ
eukprot:scaffold32821_cov58-Attheya_sp.AAC.6